jgi:prefoldin alpha subunit
MSKHEHAHNHTQDDIKRKYYELQEMEKQMKEFHGNLQVIDMQLGESARILEALEDMKKVKEGTDALVPIAEGMFIPAKLNSTQQILINAGSNTFVYKSVDEVQQLVAQQQAQIKELRGHIQDSLQELIAETEKTHEFLVHALEENQDKAE